MQGSDVDQKYRAEVLPYFEIEDHLDIDLNKEFQSYSIRTRRRELKVPE